VAGQHRPRGLAPIIFFDVAGPLAVYYGARAANLSTVVALVLSGILPAFRVVGTVLRHRRLDAIGALVLSGIALGTVTGLASGSARLYLLDGIVPTVVLGAVCLISLLSDRPMMFRLALETMGGDSQKGRAFAGLWSYPGFRRIFRIITLVWGLVFLAESALQAVIVETSSINTAKQTSNLLPVVVLVLTFAWTRVYGRQAQQRGQRLSVATPYRLEVQSICRPMLARPRTTSRRRCAKLRIGVAVMRVGGHSLDRQAWLAERRAAVMASYDADAPTYDDNPYPVETQLEWVARQLHTCPADGVVLDAPCGTGRYFSIVAAAGHRVVGVDQSAGMLAGARAQGIASSLEQVGLQELSYVDEFDAVMTIDAMENIPPEDWPRVLANLHRAARRDGLLYITVEECDDSAIDAAFETLIGRGLPAVRGEVIDGDVASYHYYPGRERVIGWLVAEGLEIVEEGFKQEDGWGYRHFLLRAP
jgi:SAM-dependent methyltransferase